ncbi:N-acetylmuramoyl-L-alanine amidase [Nodosilinea sp. FACHB-131]|uniref:N-acetylmuramoyl-L-alanine amidase n=1 Tax=Cyanophyceae TaxID=3028117 RepID=UPI001687401A|nr:N-acetylmuramoyl-L-alanine amidase [Nodosilinea sp. FACHB-131]MBD1877251.1 N-acetylmuramoyl-L-alanine amidase [Nodosilinea sp. FACHB-131]
MSSNFDLDLAIDQACDRAQQFLDKLRKDKPRDGDPRIGDVRLLDTFLRQLPITPLPDRPLRAMPLKGLGLGNVQPGDDFDLNLAIDQACDRAQQFLDQLRKNKPKDGDPRMGDVRLLDAFLRQIPILPLPDRPRGDMPLKGLGYGNVQPGDSGSVLQALKPLLEFIYSGEGGYDSYNRGRAGDSPGGWRGGLQKLTIAEIMQLQKDKKVYAVGAAQFIPTTLPIALKDSELTEKDLFNAENQDRLAIALLLGSKRPKLAAYLKGKNNDLDEAQIELAEEWASVPMPDGRGRYDGDSAGNRATQKVHEVRKALENARNALRDFNNKNNNKKPDHGSRETPKKPSIEKFIESPNFSSRAGAGIDSIVLHYTTASNVQSTINHFLNPAPPCPADPRKKCPVSAHYIIDKNGDIYQMVRDTDKAWHAGNFNLKSIGIEHVAKKGDKFTQAQEKSSIALIRWLMTEYKIPAANILAHKEAPGNTTRCPGELFGDDGSSSKLKMFNAWVAKHFERPMTPGDDADKVNEDTRSIYIVKPGDTFFRIATIHGMSVDELKALNPNISEIDKIFPGQTIIVSTSSSDAASDDGNIGFDFKIAEKFISAEAGTHQFFSNPILGAGKITGGFMELSSAHSKKGELKAIYLDNSLKTLPPANRNIGIDYVINDSQVRAWYAGTVTQRGVEKGYGNRVHILLDIEFNFEGVSYAIYQAYAHLRSISVSRGEKINQGQTIGVMGGSSTKFREGKLVLVQDAYPLHVDLDTYIRKNGERISINPQLIDKQLG